MRKAVKTDWNTRPLPSNHATLSVSRRFSQSEMDKIQLGFFSSQMDDRWFMYYEKDELYVHRSWTGACIFIATFAKIGESYEVTQLLVNRDPRQFRNTDDKEAIVYFQNIVEAFLLHSYRLPSDRL